jgi:hypothetical protein
MYLAALNTAHWLFCCHSRNNPLASNGLGNNKQGFQVTVHIWQHPPMRIAKRKRKIALIRDKSDSSDIQNGEKKYCIESYVDKIGDSTCLS